MADENRNDAADERQNEPRRGIPGKGFDAGTGYGGAGNDSAYSGESSYGGQSGLGGDRMRGAYAGEGYGREGESPDAGGGEAAEAGGSGVSIPRGTDEHAGSGGEPDTDDVPPRQVDPEGQLGAARRDPTR